MFQNPADRSCADRPLGSGSARRRRERRLRSFLRHERMTVRMELAAALHHSRDVGPGKNDGLRAQKTVNSREDAVFFELFDEDTTGVRPTGLVEPPGPQERVPRHTVEQMADVSPMVLILDAPLPQMEDQVADNLNLEHDVLDVARLMDRPISEQVIEVPKFIIDDIPTRTSVPEPQIAEQLVEVPTIISCSSLQRSVEQHVDIPVPGGGGPSSGLQGFSSGQSSTASPSKKRISERIVEQIVDPVSRGGLPGSSFSHSPTGVDERTDEPGEGVFRTFPQI